MRPMPYCVATDCDSNSDSYAVPALFQKLSAITKNVLWLRTVHFARVVMCRNVPLQRELVKFVRNVLNGLLVQLRFVINNLDRVREVFQNN